MKTQNITLDFKARYFKIGEINEQTKNVWFVCHGYGQLAEFFIKNFSVLDDGSNCIIAPEGLSRFYLNGFSGRIGATWMTKEDRLTDIKNYVTYLSNIYKKELPDIERSDLNITLLGFSQGVATISRWATQTPINYHRLILWAGVIPPDLDFVMSRKALKNVSTYIIYGDQDEYINEKQIEEQKRGIKNLDITPTTYIFEGGHTLDEDTLLKINSGLI